MSQSRGRAIITGASSGIGAAFAERLARDGRDVVLVGRRAHRLDDLASRLRERYQRRVDVVVCDLAQPSDLHTLAERVATDGSLEVLVNNAGFLHLRGFSTLDPDEIEEMIRVHVVALVRLSRAALPGMLARGRGDIINVSSIAAFFTSPGPRVAIYAATKAFVNAFTRGLRSEVQNTGVRVQAVCPGWVRTEILERHGISFEERGVPDAALMPPGVLVEASLAGLRMGEVICVPALKTPEVLDQMAELQKTLTSQVLSTGVPASRYGVAAHG